MIMTRMLINILCSAFNNIFSRVFRPVVIMTSMLIVRSVRATTKCKRTDSQTRQ